MANSYTRTAFSAPIKNMDAVKNELFELNKFDSLMDEGVEYETPAYNEYIQHTQESTPAIQCITVNDELQTIEVVVETYEDYDVLGYLLHKIISVEPEDTTWVVPYAVTCDTMRIDAFGGGVLIVTKDGWGVWSAEQLVALIANTVGDTVLVDRYIEERKETEDEVLRV